MLNCLHSQAQNIVEKLTAVRCWVCWIILFLMLDRKRWNCLTDFSCPSCAQSPSQKRKTITQVCIPGNEENYVDKKNGSQCESIWNITQTEPTSLTMFYLWQQAQLREGSFCTLLLSVCSLAATDFPSFHLPTFSNYVLSKPEAEHRPPLLNSQPSIWFSLICLIQ